jgi:hypothetical protein
MRTGFLKYIYKKTVSYFLLILFLGYFGSITFFSHTHIVDGVTIVHSHPFRSHSGNVPINHQHSENSFILIHFISHFITITSLAVYGVAIIRKSEKRISIITDENIVLNLFCCCTYLLRAPPLKSHD